MSYVIDRNGETQALPYGEAFRDGAGTLHPWAVIEHWSADELAVIGVTRAVSPEPEPLTIEQRKEALKAAARERRWQAETGGIVVNGVHIRTDEGSQSKVANAVAVFDRDPTLTSTKFEAQPNEWTELTKADLEAVGIAIGRHIVAVYERSYELYQAIDAAKTAAKLDAIDINAGWPV